MGCSKCKAKAINNLKQPFYAEEAKVLYDDILKEGMTDDIYFRSVQLFKQVFPNSTGTPVREEITQIIKEISEYYVNYRKRK